MRATIATHECFGGIQRKLAWFARNDRGLYFEIGASFTGTHTSYHVDGNMFRTSPATGLRPRFQGQYVPLDQFRGWAQLGFAMVSKERLATNPPLKEKDRNSRNILATVSVAGLPAGTINLFVELIYRDQRQWLEMPSVQPPAYAILECIELDDLIVVITVLGHDSNLLVRPTADGIQVSHYNDRYSASLPGMTYNFEAYP